MKKLTLLQIVGKAIGEPVRRLHVVTPTRSIYIDAPPARGRQHDELGPEVVLGEELAKHRRRARS